MFCTFIAYNCYAAYACSQHHDIVKKYDGIMQLSVIYYYYIIIIDNNKIIDNNQ